MTFFWKAIEGGIEIGTSTGEIPHGSELNLERPESGPGELIVSAENNTNEGGEIQTSALTSGKFFI